MTDVWICSSPYPYGFTMNFSSYDERLTLTMTCDSNVLPNPDEVMQAIRLPAL